MQRLCGRDVFCNRGHDVPLVPRIFFYCTDRELRAGSLHVQCRLQWGQWRSVHTVRGRNIQAVAGIRPMQLMQRRHVFSSRGIDMPSLFDGLQLACREFHLHLQCWLLGA